MTDYDREKLSAVFSEHAIPFAFESTDLADPQKKNLKQLFADIDIVGLGEHSHGTREVFQLKHAMFQFLVEELGFRVLAFETDFSGGLAIDNYVTGGDSDSRELLRRDGVHSIWECEAILDLVNWMRDFNVERPPEDQVRFFGMDLYWSRPTFLEAYLDRSGQADLVVKLESELTYLEEESPAIDLDIGDPEKYAATQRRVARAIQERLESERTTIVERTSEEEWWLGNKATEVLEKTGRLWEEMHDEDADSFGFRSVEMAKHALWFRDFIDTEKMAVWAHNSHIYRHELLEDDRENPRGLGLHFAAREGLSYFSLGFLAGIESVRVYSMDEKEFETLERKELPEDSLGALLAQSESDPILIDFRSIPNAEPVSAWLDLPPTLTYIGGRGELEHYDANPLAECDGMVFVNRGTPTQEI